MSISDIPGINRDPPDDKVIAICSHCKGEIYDGESYAFDGNDPICSDCLELMWEELTVNEKAWLIGLRPSCTADEPPTRGWYHG